MAAAFYGLPFISHSLWRTILCKF